MMTQQQCAVTGLLELTATVSSAAPPAASSAVETDAARLHFPLPAATAVEESSRRPACTATIPAQPPASSAVPPPVYQNVIRRTRYIFQRVRYAHVFQFRAPTPCSIRYTFRARSHLNTSVVGYHWALVVYSICLHVSGKLLF